MDSLIFSGTAARPSVLMMPGQVLQEKQQDEPPGVMNLVIVQGDTKSFPLTLSLNGYEPLDLTGATIRFTAKESPKDPQSAAIIEKAVGAGITVVDAPEGKITIDFVPTDTEAKEELLPLTFDIEVTTAASARYTLIRGIFTITNGASN